MVHLIERPLLEEADYVLDRKATVTFQGKAGLLPWAIGKVKPGISWDPTSSDGPEGADWGRADWETEVTVDCVDKPIRDILTQYLPLDTYQPLLWRSVKYDTTVPSRTIVRYLGTTPDDDAGAPMCLPEGAARPAWVPEDVDFHKVPAAVRQAVAPRSMVPASQPGGQ